jgi:hypothetical protein
MTTTQVVETIAAPTDAVWAALSDFAGIQVGGPIESFEIEGEGVGAVRTIGLANGVVIERLDNHDASAGTFTYSILNDDSPLPVTGYSATVNIIDAGDGNTTVEWTGTYQAEGPEEAAVAVVTGIYTGGIAQARNAVT